MSGLAPFDLYPFNPSGVAAYAYLVLFAIVGVGHLFYTPFLRAWFGIPLILGCVGEAFGYWGRSQSHNNIRDGGAYLVQLMLLLASPPLIAATIYMTLGRVIRCLQAEEYSMMRTSWLTKIYVIVDIGSFVCQMAGSAMQSSGDPAGIQLGVNIVIGGLVFQLVAFLFFIAMAARVHFLLNREPTHLSRNPLLRWRQVMWALYASSMLVLIRNLYRIIEFASGNSGPVYTHEAYVYVFDGSLMFLVVFLMLIFHPGRLFRTLRKMGDVGYSRSGEEILLEEHK